MAINQTNLLRYTVKPIHLKEIEEREGEQYRIAYGLVIDPDYLDADTNKKVDSKDVEYTAHYFMSHYDEIGTPEGCSVVESYIVPVENAKIGPFPVTKGSWVMAFEITNSDLLYKITNSEFEGIVVTLSTSVRETKTEEVTEPLKEEDTQLAIRETNEAELLGKFGISRSQIRDYQILCLPENFDEAASMDELLDTKQGVNLCEQFKQAGLKTANSFDLKIHQDYYHRKSAIDLWLGTIWVLDYVVLSLVVNIIGSLIAQRLNEFWESVKNKPVLLSQMPTANFTINIELGDKVVINKFVEDLVDVQKRLDELDDKFQHLTSS
jgi:hypothetical protein